MFHFSIFILLGLAAIAAAHPGYEENQVNANLKRNFLRNSRVSLSKCAEQAEFRTLQARAASRRRGIASRLTKKDSITGGSQPGLLSIALLMFIRLPQSPGPFRSFEHLAFVRYHRCHVRFL
jgi:hypothetical protein